jgi:hypothetical protein
MDSDRIVKLLEEIRDSQRQMLESHRQALLNQQEAIRAQADALSRGRKLQVGLGLAIAAVLAVVLLLLGYVLRNYS